MPRSPRRDRLIDDFDELFDQLRFILSQVRGMIIGNRVKDIRRESSQPGRGMRVSRRNRKPLAREPMLFFELCKHSLGDFDWHAAVIDGDEDDERGLGIGE